LRFGPRCGILSFVGVEPVPLLRYRCTGCGYGASRRQAPERCPMCGDEHWEEEGWRPFAAFATDLTPPIAASLGDMDAPLAREAGKLGSPEIPRP
jgi:hypothetical protein